MAKPRGSLQVKPGTCGAALASGLRCRAKANAETGRCRHHKPITGGPQSPGWFLKSLSAKGRDAIEKMAADPGLLDPKLPVALHAMSMQELPFELSAENLEMLARKEAADRLGVGIDGVGDQVADLDRYNARVKVFRLTSRAAFQHGEMVGIARKALDAEDVMRGEMLPLMLDFAKMMGTLAKRYMPTEYHARFEADVAASIAATVGRMQSAKHELVDAAQKVGR
jgi:hypothetical protein